MPWLICPFSSTSASPASQAPGCSSTRFCPPASTKLSLLLLFLFLLVPYQVLSLGCCWGQAECSALCEVQKGSRKSGRGGSCNAEPRLLLSLPLHPHPGLPSWSVHPPPVGFHASDLLEAKPRALNEAMTLNQEACIIDRKPKKAQGEEQGRTETGSGNGASSHPGVKVTFQDLVLKAGGLQRGCGL